MALPQRDDAESMPPLDHRPPADPVSWYMWDEMEEGIQDAQIRTRGQARAYYCKDTGADFTTVKVRKRYARTLTRREQYQDYLDRLDQWDDYDPPPPSEPPSDWVPHEGVPCWEFCQADDEGAAPVWMVSCEDAPN